MKRIFNLTFIVLSLLICGCTSNKVEKGVSYEMAKARKNVVLEIQYSLQFTIPENINENITGKNTINFLIEKDESKYLYLDFNESKDKLKNIQVNRKPAKLIFENEHIVVPTNLLITGYNEIVVEFIAGNLSLNRNPDYLYTLFVPDRASTCFPSFDQPDLKASFFLELSVPKDWEAVSNSRMSMDTEENGRRVMQFMLSKPISTYQFAFAAGKFKKLTDPSTAMTMYYRETDSAKVAANAKDIFNLHKSSVAWMEEYTNYQYPFLKFDFVLIPTFQYGGMEHPGNIFYRESSLFLEETASVNQKMRRASLIAHETAHMWFGNLVTMKWFDDVWLKEVFANFMAAKIVNPQFPEINHDLRFLMAHYPTAYSIDRSEGSHPIQQNLDNLKNAGTLYGGIIYQKAPIMMRNLESIMGDENFRSGLRDYLIIYGYKNASWDDLVVSLKKFTDKDLEMWNKAWIKSKGMPTIEYSINNNLNIKVTNDTAGVIWPQAFQYQIISDHGQSVRDIIINDTDGASIEVSESAIKVIPNYKGRGYGFFEADKASRQEMLQSVNSIEDTEARAAVWMNIWEYVLRGELGVKQALETMISCISQEKNPLILEYISNNMNTLYWQFTTAEDRQMVSQKVDDTLFETMALEKDISRKRILFNCFKKVANSKEGIENLKKFWRNEMTLGLDISEQDHIELAYEIAVRDEAASNLVLQTQLENTQNPDRKKAMQFTIPALSADEKVRDAFFDSLKVASHREHEPWVLDALSYLHHPLRAKQSVKYIKPSLELLQEIQLTGDIFFPTGWANETVSNYQSKEAADAVRQFLKDNPTLSPNLKNKLLQSADMLFRAEKILSASDKQNM